MGEEYKQGLQVNKFVKTMHKNDPHNGRDPQF